MSWVWEGVSLAMPTYFESDSTGNGSDTHDHDDGDWTISTCEDHRVDDDAGLLKSGRLGRTYQYVNDTQLAPQALCTLRVTRDNPKQTTGLMRVSSVTHTGGLG